MTAAHWLAAILAADVGAREHRDGPSENRASGSFPQRNHEGAQVKRRALERHPRVGRIRTDLKQAAIRTSARNPSGPGSRRSM